ncbi:hypothetical protein CBM2625_A200258 [Cupriavidus taiwanensis]|uniref:Uncharacterized protein n=1 Tax=Cupriavidus taiwanensis TaxID=164546 RepID=A0A375E203_9BURK|nr:hypothetical protein CBM2613_A250255 [Cupriavidus taiwanensis]SPA05733.1 hypothetical protein CBM2625_A200258 [Cupriavidus taiwanensis]
MRPSRRIGERPALRNARFYHPCPRSGQRQSAAAGHRCASPHSPCAAGILAHAVPVACYEVHRASHRCLPAAALPPSDDALHNKLKGRT